MPYRTLTKNQQYYLDKIAAIMANVDALEAQPEHTERDVAMARELCQKYSDVLDEMLDEMPADSGIIVQVSGQKIKIKNEQALSEWMAKVMG